MAERLSVDTTFLIDFQRERRRSDENGPAHRFLSSAPERELYLATVALGEFVEGFEDTDHPVLRTVRELHTLLPVDEETALLYGRLARELRADGRLIGTNDLWIGATSLRWELPVLTANPAEFSRIEGLSVVSYR